MFAPLYPRFNDCVLKIVSHLMPKGFDVTEHEHLCNSYEKVAQHYRHTGRILVWTGASDNTIFGYPQHNHAFRAWHDYVHVTYGLPFNEDGERMATKIQQHHVMEFHTGTPCEAKFFCRILDAEINGQIEYFCKHGKFVEDQRAFVQNYLAS